MVHKQQRNTIFLIAQATPFYLHIGDNPYGTILLRGKN